MTSLAAPIIPLLVPTNEVEHDQLLSHLRKVQADITERERRLQQDNAPDLARITARNAEANHYLIPLQRQVEQLLVLSYGYAKTILANSSAAGPRSRQRPHGSFGLHRSPKPEVVIDDVKALMAELRHRHLLNKLTVVKRTVSKEAMIVFKDLTAKLRHAKLVYNETYTVTTGGIDAKAFTSDLEQALSHLET